jgi:hypothetical protein
MALYRRSEWEHWASGCTAPARILALSLRFWLLNYRKKEACEVRNVAPDHRYRQNEDDW